MEVEGWSAGLPSGYGLVHSDGEFALMRAMRRSHSSSTMRSGSPPSMVMKARAPSMEAPEMDWICPDSHPSSTS
jgi:hypothetical protein